jgi:hypothetical protein
VLWVHGLKPVTFTVAPALAAPDVKFGRGLGWLACLYGTHSTRFARSGQAIEVVPLHIFVAEVSFFRKL